MLFMEDIKRDRLIKELKRINSVQLILAFVIVYSNYFKISSLTILFAYALIAIFDFLLDYIYFFKGIGERFYKYYVQFFKWLFLLIIARSYILGNVNQNETFIAQGDLVVIFIIFAIYLGSRPFVRYSEFIYRKFLKSKFGYIPFYEDRFFLPYSFIIFFGIVAYAIKLLPLYIIPFISLFLISKWLFDSFYRIKKLSEKVYLKYKRNIYLFYFVLSIPVVFLDAHRLFTGIVIINIFLLSKYIISCFLLAMLAFMLGRRGTTKKEEVRGSLIMKYVLLNNRSFTTPVKEKVGEYLKKVRKSGYKNPVIYVDRRNFEEILPFLNVPEKTKDEVKREVKKRKKIIISEAAFLPEWKNEERYIVVEEEETPLKSCAKRSNIQSDFSTFFFIGRAFGLRGENKKRFYEYVSHLKEYKRIKRANEEMARRKLYKELGPQEYRRKRLEKLDNSIHKTQAGLVPLNYIVKVDNMNMRQLLPVLFIPGEVKDKIEDLLNNDKIVIITEAAFQPEWKWDEKYLVFDKKKT